MIGTDKCPPPLTNALRGQVGLPQNDTNVQGGYTVPDNDTVKAIYDQMPEDSKAAFIADTNGDRIEDSAVILLGLRKGVELVRIPRLRTLKF